MKLVFIGREEMMNKAISEKNYLKHDFHYTSISENHFDIRNELEKLYALKDIDAVLIDNYCVDDRNDFVKHLKIFHTIRSYVKIVILTDKKFYHDEFEVVYFPSSESEKEEQETSPTSLTDKIKFKLTTRKKVHIESKKSKQEKEKVEPILNVKSISMPKLPKFQWPKKIEPEHNEESKAELLPEEKKNMPVLRKRSKIEKNEALKKKEKNKEKVEPILDFTKLNTKLKSLRVPSFSLPTGNKNLLETAEEGKTELSLPLEKVTVFTSAFPLQGKSFLINRQRKEKKKVAVLDLNFSYLSYTEFQDMDHYISNTLLLPEFLEKNTSGIYTVSKETELRAILEFLKKEYDYVLIDSNEPRTIPGDPLTYFVLTEDFSTLEEVKKIPQKENYSFLVNRYTQTIDKKEFSFLRPIFIPEFEH